MNELEQLRSEWNGRWPAALAEWSRFVKLSEPRWCFTEAEEKREGLTGSFAMIRLPDQAVVISLRQVRERGLQRFGLEIAAHEIGHHVYCPGNLTDQGRMVARMRRALPTKEMLAPVVANLYSDLLINDRLQRGGGLDMAAIYRELRKEPSQVPSRTWTFYMRTYEILWSLEKGTLAEGRIDQRLEGDAQLGARLIRSYARDWLDGAGRFAALALPYLLEDGGEDVDRLLRGWLDAKAPGHGSAEAPFGLTEVEEGEEEGTLHPCLDPELTGMDEPEILDETEGPGEGRSRIGGHRKHREYRGPLEYGELLQGLGLELSEHEAAVRYYRERAVPHLIPFPSRAMPESVEPLPEGLEAWEPGMPVEDIDWLQSVLVSPYLVPGLTTVQRTFGTDRGSLPERMPIDLYLGIDCSGSMPNPQAYISYPVLAGAIIAVSALRAGSRVMAVLSGEPGRALSTSGFVSGERQVLQVLTDYLGTGYAFGIHRLRDTFSARKPGERPVHILIVTDHDIFSILGEKHRGMDGWQVAASAAAGAGGGGSYVLHMPADWEPEKVARMRAEGWQVHSVQDVEDLVAFARAFSRLHYGEEWRGGGRAVS